MTIDRYSYWLEQTAQGDFCAHFPDLPGLEVKAPTLARLLPLLHDELVTFLEEYLKDAEVLEAPASHPARLGEETLYLRPTIVTKLALIEAVKKQHLSVAELARRLDCLPQEAARILRLSHPTKIDTMMGALQAVGLQLQVNAIASPFTANLPLD